MPSDSQGASCSFLALCASLSPAGVGWHPGGLESLCHWKQPGGNVLWCLFSPRYSTVTPLAAALGSHPDVASPYAGMAERGMQPSVALLGAAAGGKSMRVTKLCVTSTTGCFSSWAVTGGRKVF